ncbi:hypothetical protein Y1Q_0008032 [Alligator mississippiensis]|uniref:Uncharacterized protein n=1 Tax=Alligator mississippiensis TaxID=8496 RepID=A0A151NF94_ALLMI|nr:hypothetical protein Y1Q_0008032 [Alligator mississippiensis]
MSEYTYHSALGKETWTWKKLLLLWEHDSSSSLKIFTAPVSSLLLLLNPGLPPNCQCAPAFLPAGQP